MSAVAPARGVSPVRSSGIFIGRSLLHSLRDGEGLLMAIALPVLMMLMFTLVTAAFLPRKHEASHLLDDADATDVAPRVLLH